MLANRGLAPAGSPSFSLEEGIGAVPVRLEGDAMVGALIVQEGGVHYGVIRVHPEGVPDTHPERLPQVQAQSTVVTLRTVPNPVGRVRKFWGEFF